jgi:hypothetical protein
VSSKGREDDAQRRRRKFRRQEFQRQVRLTELLVKYLDSECTAWSSLENRPRSVVAGMLAKRAGVRSGIPDTLVIFRGLPIFVELKSDAGVPSKTQLEFREALVAAGARWWWVRSPQAALTALQRSGVEFRRPWSSRALRAWEGPFAGEEAPEHPAVVARRRAYARRWRERNRARALEEAASA